MSLWLKLIPYIALVAAVVTLALGVYKAGEKSAQLKCAKEQIAHNAAVTDEVKKYESTKAKIRSLDDDELIRRYCHWVYDISYSECVRTYKFVQ